MSDTFEHYARDCASIIREQALKARIAALAARGTADADYYQGYLMAMHRVASLLQQQAKAFGIPPVALDLADFDADRDLLSRRSASNPAPE